MTRRAYWILVHRRLAEGDQVSITEIPHAIEFHPLALEALALGWDVAIQLDRPLELEYVRKCIRRRVPWHLLPGCLVVSTAPVVGASPHP